MSEVPSRRRLSRLVPLDAALAALSPFLSPIAPLVVPICDALGRVLAEPLVAPGMVPPTAIAAQDGFAVPAQAIQGAGPYAPVVIPGPPAIEVGQPMPAGTDAVIAAHLVRIIRGAAEISGEAAPGEGAVAAGDDFVAGAVIRSSGQPLRPVDIGLVLAAGVETVAVRTPRVVLLLAGDEIVAAPGHDALGPMLAAAVARVGAAAAPPIVLQDDEAAIVAALRAAEADLILVCGGTGLGASDRSVAALASAGTLLAHGIAIRPGTTAALGQVGGAPVILLPGRLSECFGALLLLVLPAVRRLAGAAEPLPRTYRLARKIASQAGFAELALLACRGGSADPLATGALPLSAIAAADGYAVIPAASEGLEAGAEIAVLDI